MQKIQILLQHKEKVNVYSNYVRPHVSTLQCTYIDGPQALCMQTGPDASKWKQYILPEHIIPRRTSILNRKQKREGGKLQKMI